MPKGIIVFATLEEAVLKLEEYSKGCSKICRMSFNTISEHTEFVSNGGCGNMITAIAHA